MAMVGAEKRRAARLIARGLLALVILASLVVRLHKSGLPGAPGAQGAGVEARLRELLRGRGLTLAANPHPPSKAMSRAVYFQRPGCGAPSWVIAYPLSSELLPLFERNLGPGFERRFVYLDKSWDHQDRFAMYVEWGKNWLSAGLGRPAFATWKTGLFIAEPADCAKNPDIDWRPAWSAPTTAAAPDSGD